MKIKFFTNILLLKTLLYRIIAITVYYVLFGARIALLGSAVAIVVYFVYDYCFSKFFGIRAENNGAVLWFTGLPCSGKTTLADEVNRRLKTRGFKTERLDGDIVRKEGLSEDLGFTKEDRERNIGRVAFVSKVLSRNKVIVLASFVSPYKKVRDFVRESVTNFVEIYVYAPTEECIKRDVKGMWQKARAGEIENFTGYSAPYEPPFNPQIEVDTQKETLNQSADKVMKYLKQKKLI